MIRFWTATIILAGLLVAIPSQAAIKTPADKFVRTANYYMRAGRDLTPEIEKQIAQYDLLVLPVEVQIWNPGTLRRLRDLNPNIILLAYMPTKSYITGWGDDLHKKLLTGIDDSWWLLNANGANVSVWPGTKALNTVSGWSTYLPTFIKDNVWSSGLWDGVFYDELSATISWSPGVDIHRTGRATDSHLADTAWRRSTVNMLQLTRELLGPDAVIISNGDSDSELSPHVNGRMFEMFPTPWEGRGTWSDTMRSYLRLEKEVGFGKVMVINGSSRNSGVSTDYKNARYTVTSTLLGDGYFSYDYGDKDHGQLWRYDEDKVMLGRPLAAPANVLAPGLDGIAPGVWRRDFEKGSSLVNSTTQARTIQLGGDFEKIKGAQDPAVNNGAVVNSVTLPAADGIILLRTVESLSGTVFPNGAFARIYGTDGKQRRNGFFAYSSAANGGDAVIVTDLSSAAGIQETIVGSQGRVTIYQGGKQRLSFAPFGDSFKLGLRLAVGDLDGDGAQEIVVGAGNGGGPQVRVFNQDGKLLHPGFFAFDSTRRGGVNVAVGKVGINGAPAIIVGSGAGADPVVRVFSMKGSQLWAGFLAYNKPFKGGVNVAAGDLDGDGRDEIITGPGYGGGPQVRIWTPTGRALGPGFFAGSKTSISGVAVATYDLEGDGVQEIVAFNNDAFRAALK